MTLGAHARDGAARRQKRAASEVRTGAFTHEHTHTGETRELNNTGLSMLVFLHIFSLFLFILFLLDYSSSSFRSSVQLFSASVFIQYSL